MDKCILCKTNSANTLYTECKHHVYCADCVGILYENNQLDDKCPSCTKISYSMYTTCTGGCNYKMKLISFNRQYSSTYYPHSICYTCDPRYQNTISFLAEPVPNKHIKVLMLLLNKSVTESQWIDRFKECYKMIEEDAKKNNTVYLFTTEQMIAIGQFMIKFPLSQSYNNMRNVLAALCLYPWELPLEPFSFGVCYFGNLGETPSSATVAVDIITNNIQKWKEMRYDINP